MFMQEADPVGIKEAVLQDFLHAKLKIFGWNYISTCWIHGNMRDINQN